MKIDSRLIFWWQNFEPIHPFVKRNHIHYLKEVWVVIHISSHFHILF